LNFSFDENTVRLKKQNCQQNIPTSVLTSDILICLEMKEVLGKKKKVMQ